MNFFHPLLSTFLHSHESENVVRWLNMKEKELERILKALANKRRLAIISFLKKKKEANVGDIAEAIRLSIKSTSRHLTVLSGADLLDREQRSSEVFYRLNNLVPDIFTPLIKSL